MAVWENIPLDKKESIKSSINIFFRNINIKIKINKIFNVGR